MNKNILIINTYPNINPLFDFFEELNNHNYILSLLAADQKLINNFNKKNWYAKKIFSWPDLSKLPFLWLFIILSPLLYLLAFAYLLYFKINKKIDALLCFHYGEKLIFTPVAKTLGIKTYWFECPDIYYARFNKILKFLYRLNSGWTQIIALTSFTKNQLKNFKLKPENIKIIQPGIKLSHWQHQVNIFAKLAETEQRNLKRKFFTVGTIANLNSKQNIEILFQATKKCLAVIPNLQIIIVGDGRERKNLNWLAKKMEIDNLVWFVGEQTYLKKWLDNFDIFIFISKILTLADLNTTLYALYAELPIIGPGSIGLEDIIVKNENGILIEMDNSEALAQHIISLEQNRNLRIQLGRRGKAIINQYFSLEAMTEQFIGITKL